MQPNRTYRAATSCTYRSTAASKGPPILHPSADLELTSGGSLRHKPLNPLDTELRSGEQASFRICPVGSGRLYRGSSSPRRSDRAAWNDYLDEELRRRAQTYESSPVSLNVKVIGKAGVKNRLISRLHHVRHPLHQFLDTLTAPRPRDRIGRRRFLEVEIHHS